MTFALSVISIVIIRIVIVSIVIVSIFPSNNFLRSLNCNSLDRNNQF